MLRGSTSVAARIVHNDQEFCLLADSAEEDVAVGVVKVREQLPRKPKRTRRVVRVLDFAESSRCGAKKFLHFAERLHPWNTIKELKQKIHQIKGYHVHRQRLYLNNAELLNSETLDYYGLLCEQREEHTEDQEGAQDTIEAAGQGRGDEEMRPRSNSSDYSKNQITGRDQDVKSQGQQNHG